MAQINVPAWQVPPGGYHTVFNAGTGDIPANMCLVPDSTADRAAKLPGTASTATTWAFSGVTQKKIPGSTTVVAGGSRYGDVAASMGDVAVCTASGTVTKGDTVFLDSAAGKEGRVKKYTNFGTDGVVGIVGHALTTGADGELVEVRLAFFVKTA